jgi:uncharacterized membrane protein
MITAPRPTWSTEAPKPIWVWVAMAIAVGGLGISALRLLVPYSYWLDELYSVTASAESWPVLFGHLLGDVHPPLYQLVLKVWIGCFGQSELATRSLSWLCAVTALGILTRAAWGHGPVVLITATPFFATNIQFSYYANETRSYALVLLLATLVATTYPTGNRTPGIGYCLSCLLLALTHYFGLIIAGASILVCLAQNLGRRDHARRLILLGIACLVWPFCHAAFGGLLSKSGGNFWIKVNGVLDTLGIATAGLIPRFSGKGLPLLLAGAIVAAALAWYHRRRARDQQFGPEASVPILVLNFTGITVGFLALVATIDLWTPISTSRNYIVLLPFLALVLGGACSLLATSVPVLRPLILLAVFAISLDAAKVGHRQLTVKARAEQDWKGASTLMAAEAEGRNLYYIPLGNTKGNTWVGSVANHYLVGVSQGRLRAQEYRLGETNPERPAIVLFGHNHGERDLLFPEMERLGARQIFPGYNAAHWLGPGFSVGVFLIP